VIDTPVQEAATTMDSSSDILNDLLGFKPNDNTSTTTTTTTTTPSSSSDSRNTPGLLLTPANISSECKQHEEQAACSKLNTLTRASDEFYSLMQKQLEITQLDGNYSESNPRKDSPVPVSPPTNIIISNNANETSNNIDNSVTGQATSQAAVNKQLFRPIESACNHNSNTNGVNSKQSQPGKSPKIGTNLDKWLKELKGHVLVKTLSFD